MTITRRSLYQAFKYTIYLLLTYNIVVFFTSEFTAAATQFSDGVGRWDMIEAYAATIDTTAWVVLLLMFELETYVLEDRHFTPAISRSLHVLRAICYGFIIYSFYGYIVNLLTLFDVSALPNVANLCALATDNWSYAPTLDEFVDISAANCAQLSNATVFIQFDGVRAVVDASDLRDMRVLAWVDVINAAVWILVVIVLEFDVRLQENDQLVGTALRISKASKFVLYSLLLVAAIYWGFKGDFIDFWDAFLWLVAFVFIELNVFEWRQETLEDEAAAATN